MAEDDLKRSRSQDSLRKYDAVARATIDLSAAGYPFSVQDVANAAGVHRSFIYRHPELRLRVSEAENVTNRHSPQDSGKSVTALLSENHSLKAVNARLMNQIAALEKRLSELLGEAVYRDTGLGAGSAEVAAREEVERLKHLLMESDRKVSIAQEDLQATREVNKQLLLDMNKRL